MNDIKKPLIQVQPRYDFRDDWGALAEKEDLYYEALDFSTQPALTEGGLFEEYREWYSSNKRTSSVHGCFIDVNPASGDPAFRDLSKRRCEESCRTASLIGAKIVVFHSSCFPFLRGIYLDVWVKRCADFYLEMAERYKVSIFIENSMDIDAGPIKALMRAVNDERVGVCLDIGHANYSSIPIRQWFEELGEWIGYIHLSDNKGVYDDHIMLGEGTIDWEEADSLWRGLKRDTVITIEVNGVAASEAAVTFLREHGYFGM